MRLALSLQPYVLPGKLQGLDFKIDELTIERQCDNVFIEQAAEAIRKSDAVLSLGCGAGVQAIAERYADKPVYAGLNTKFLGILEGEGCGPRNVLHAEHVCSMNTAAFVPGDSLCQAYPEWPLRRFA